MPEEFQFETTLLDAGLIDKDQFEGYQARAAKEKKHFGLLLLQDGVLDDIELAQTLSLQLGLPLVRLTQLRIPDFVAKMLPKEKAEQYLAIPVIAKTENDQDVLYVAFFDPTDTVAIEEIEKLTNKPVKVVVSPKTDITAAFKKFFRDKKKKRSWGRGQKAEVTETQSETAILDNELPLPEVDTEDLPPVVTDKEEVYEAVAVEVEDSLFSPEVDIEFDDDDGLLEMETSVVDDDEDVTSGILEVGLEDLDLDGFGSSQKDAVEVKPSAKAVETKSASDSFEDFGDDFASDFDIEDDELPDAKEGKTKVNWLKIDEDKLDGDDERIIKLQEEALKTKQTKAYDSKLDLDFDDSFSGESVSDKSKSVSDKSASNESDSDISILTDSDDEDIAKMEVLKASDQTVEQLDSLGGDDLDFDDLGQDDDLGDVSLDEELDFDIPEAPEFSSKSSNNLDNTDLGLGEESSKNKRQPTSQNEISASDWSLDVDNLFASNSKNETVVNPAPEYASFEDAAAELDALLGDDSSLDASISIDTGISIDTNMLDRLAALAENPDQPASDEDIALMNDFINGDLEQLTDDNSKKAKELLSTLTRNMIDKGLIEKP